MSTWGKTSVDSRCGGLSCDVVVTTKEGVYTSNDQCSKSALRIVSMSSLEQFAFLAMNIDPSIAAACTFASMYSDAQPAWLRKSRSLQRRRRSLELRAECCRSAVYVASNRVDKLKDGGRAYGVPLRALGVLNERLKNAENELLVLTNKRKAFLEKQAAEEVIQRNFLHQSSIQNHLPGSQT